jgi:hexosaminidase
MARLKLNTLHLHLTDDQGWRIESARFPLLTAVGSVRDQSPLPWHRDEGDGVPYGPYFFTQAEMRELVAYARAFEVRVVPEVEMPGHCLAALAAYPQFSCTGGPFAPLDYWGGVPDVFCPGNDATLAFLQSLLDELFDVFDSPFVHVGGDECSHERWKACPKCQARMRALGLPDTDALQSWFIGQMAQWISARGRRLVGWDEILEGGLPNGTTVMSWEGTQGGIAAAKLGHEVVMSPGADLYLDRCQFPNDDGYEYISGLVTLHQLYAYNPTDGFDASLQKYVIGAQGNLWTEYVWAQADLEWKVFPRSAAVAEIAWTADAQKDWGRFLAGLANVELPRLAILGKNYAPLASGLAAKWGSREIPSTWVTMQWPITGALGAALSYELAFVCTGGVNSLRINRVRLYISGNLVGSDDHDGVAGPQSLTSIYAIKTTVDATSAKVYVTANVTCDGGLDCAGSLFAYAA